MKLTFLRHGITEGNVRRLYYGSTDLPLLPEGISALEALRLAGGYPRAGRFYTSGMTRTEQTLLALYGAVPHEVLRDLREIDFGAFEMKTYEDLKEDPDFAAWCTGNNESNVCPGGESGAQVTARSLGAVQTLLERGEDAVIITHGGVIGGLMNTWFPTENSRYAYTPHPGTGFAVTFTDGIPVSWEKVPG